MKRYEEITPYATQLSNTVEADFNSKDPPSFLDENLDIWANGDSKAGDNEAATTEVGTELVGDCSGPVYAQCESQDNLKISKGRKVTHCSITIDQGTKGHSYESIIGPHIRGDERSVQIDMPHLNKEIHFQNIDEFGDFLQGQNIRELNLHANKDPKENKFSIDVMAKLKQKEIDLFCHKEDRFMHDHKIAFDNGLLILSDKGLDIYNWDCMKLPQVERKCIDTVIDVFAPKDSGCRFARCESLENETVCETIVPIMETSKEDAEMSEQAETLGIPQEEYRENNPIEMSGVIVNTRKDYIEVLDIPDSEVELDERDRNALMTITESGNISVVDNFCPGQLSTINGTLWNIKLDHNEELSVSGIWELIRSLIGDTVGIKVKINDPYLNEDIQMENFSNFCDVLQTWGIKEIDLTTNLVKEESLLSLKDETENEDVLFEYDINENLHSRRIEFDNDVPILIGRGLDFFRSGKSLKTTIYIFKPDCPLVNDGLSILDETVNDFMACQLALTRYSEQTAENNYCNE